jgi:UDP-N-acetylmuramyl tripeptide synthase
MNKRPIKFYIAILFTRITIFILRAMGHQATHVPGRVALAFCPEFLKHIGKPKKLIAITGTNGKTTVSNMIGDYFVLNKIPYAHNGLGSNIQEGIIVAILQASTFFGNNNIPTMVLEVDERVSLKIYPYLKPDVLIVTNLFRDSYKRNAHVEFIKRILEECIPKETTLVLNADDILSSTLMPTNKRLYYGIAPLKGEVEKNDCLIHDSKHCPICDYPLNYTFTRYHHIGQAHCTVCGFKNAEADILVHKVNKNTEQAIGLYRNKTFKFDFKEESLMDLYNRLAMLSGLIALGFDIHSIIKTLDTIKTVNTRFNETEVGDKRIILMLAKDQNPIACSRVFDTISQQTDRQIGVLLINENNENHRASENMAWYYDADFERLNRNHIKQVIEGGYRYKDFIVRAKLASISPETIDGALNELLAAEKLDFSKIDTAYVLYGTKNMRQAKQVKEYLIQKASKEVTL